MSRDSKLRRYAEQIDQDVTSDYATKPGGTTGNFVSIAASGDLADSSYTATDFASRVAGGTSDNFASLDASGDIQDSGYDVTSFIDVVTGHTTGNLASLTAGGDVQDSGSKVADFATIVSGGTTNNFTSLTAGGDIQDSGKKAADFADASDATPNAVIGDAVGRQFRQSYILIVDGTNANTLKCTLFSLFNGDAIAVTDNISKGGTTGDYSLNAGGTQLTIEASGLTGNAVMAQGAIRYDESNTTNPTLGCYASGNDILISIFSAAVEQDLTALVDVGGGAAIHVNIMYLTDA